MGHAWMVRDRSFVTWREQRPNDLAVRGVCANRSRFDRPNWLAKTLKFDLHASDKPSNASRKGDVVRLDELRFARATGCIRRRAMPGGLKSRIRFNLKESLKWQ
ncbi:MAG TPA: hypothetical protein VLE94_20930 [Burkholderiaceae bacterium]|nr:hypothetical protein [Burkholderiaceae bacterium]